MGSIKVPLCIIIIVVWCVGSRMTRRVIKRALVLVRNVSESESEYVIRRKEGCGTTCI